MTNYAEFHDQLAASLERLAEGIRSGRVTVSEVSRERETSATATVTASAEEFHDVRFTGHRTLTLRYWEAP